MFCSSLLPRKGHRCCVLCKPSCWLFLHIDDSTNSYIRKWNMTFLAQSHILIMSCPIMGSGIKFNSFLTFPRYHIDTWLKQLYHYKGSGGNKKLPPRSFSTVGIEREFCQASTQLSPQTSSPWCSVCLPNGVDSMNLPNQTRGRSSEGAGRELLGGVLHKSIK